MALTDGMTPEQISTGEARYALHITSDTADWLISFAAGFKGSKADRAAFTAVGEALRASLADGNLPEESTGQTLYAVYLPLFDADGVSCEARMGRVLDVLNKRAGRSKADKEAIMELRTEFAGAMADVQVREVPAPVVLPEVTSPAPVEESAPASTLTPQERAEYQRLTLASEAAGRLLARAEAAGAGVKVRNALTRRLNKDNLSAPDIDALAEELYPAPVEGSAPEVAPAPVEEAPVKPKRTRKPKAAPAPVPDAPDVVATPDADDTPATPAGPAPVDVIAVTVGEMLNKWAAVAVTVTEGASRMTRAERAEHAAGLARDFSQACAMQADADGKGTHLGSVDGGLNRIMHAARKILRHHHAVISGEPQFAGDRLPKASHRVFRRAVAPWRADATAALSVAQ